MIQDKEESFIRAFEKRLQVTLWGRLYTFLKKRCKGTIVEWQTLPRGIKSFTAEEEVFPDEYERDLQVSSRELSGTLYFGF